VTIVLRPLREDDEAELRRIHETPDVARWWGMPEPGFPWSDDPDSTRLAIELDGALAGMIEFWEEPTPRYRHATIDLFLDPAVRGRGIGGDAVAQLAQKLFAERGHHRVTIDPSVENLAAIRAYEKAGFTRVGVMRGYEREPDGPHWRDGLLMELLADDARP
jgi:aminoglycoside 6'-N-acetyltransferase